jgi:CDP-glycerol glycerophosphotransferase
VGALVGGSAFILNGPIPATKQLLMLPEVADDKDARESVQEFARKFWWRSGDLWASLLLFRERTRPITNYIPTFSPRLRAKAFVAWMLPFLRNTPSKNAWIFGERGGYGGDDSSYFFFRWMREKHPEQDSYFILCRRHLERIPSELRPWVLIQGSFEHYHFLYRAAVVVFNFSGMDLARDWKLLGLLGQLPKPLVRVFLNHGVTAIHQVNNHWRFDRMSSHFEEHDIFTVSSVAEKRIFVERMGHPEANLRVTGITRLDGILGAHPTRESPNRVLYVPTWRPWLRYGTSDTLMGSRFYAEVFQLLHDPMLHAMLEERGASLTMLTHHVFKPFVAELKALGLHRVSILDMHSEDIQAHLRDSHLLITDYSSISFDFAYMNKPVLYYQFDQSEFYRNRGGFFADPNSELPGKTVTTREELFRELQEVISDGWRITPENERRIGKFFEYRDANNCQRVYEAIIETLSTRR